MRKAVTGSVAVALIASAWWLTSRGPEETSTAREKPVPREKAAVSRGPSMTTTAERSSAAVIRSGWNDLIAWLDGAPRPTPDEIRARLLELRGTWAEMDPHMLAETIAGLLRDGRDAETGLRFLVGLHGLLDEWPTARVFLLDALAPADPDAAADLAREILAATSSPDEYAVALRPLARDGIARADNSELLACFQTLLSRNDWHQSAGFAESLDLARTIGTPESATALLSWPGNPKLRSMALHELAAEHPGALAAPLAAAPHLDPPERAALMARLDPASPGQTSALDTYLTDSTRTAGERAAFLRLFPLRSATTGHRLYSRAPAPYTADAVAAGDRAALELTRKWLANPALNAEREPLRALEARLENWIDSQNR